MSGKDRINIFPSRGAQTLMKSRLKGAEKGHRLLKSKADALQFRFRIILKKIIETKQTMGEVRDRRDELGSGLGPDHLETVCLNGMRFGATCVFDVPLKASLPFDLKIGLLLAGYGWP
jgi:hypothetical protein